MHRLLRRAFTQPVRAAAGRRYVPVVLELESRDVPSAPAPPAGFLATTTPFTNTTPVAISATGTPTVTSTISVSGAGTFLHDVDLTTFIQHTFSSDLNVTLQSPAGTVVTVTTGNAGGFDNVFNGTLFDDDADPGSQVPYLNSANTVTDAAYADAVVKPTLTPEEPLGAFRGENPNGTWTITIFDAFDLDGGSLDQWKLDVTTLNAVAVPTGPATFETTTPVAIPAAGTPTVTSTVTVSGAPTYLNRLTLQTFIQHTFSSDLNVTLQSPAGTVVTVTTGNAGGFDNVFNGTLFDDDADPAGQVPYAAAPNLASDAAYANAVVETPLTPEEALAAFVGENPNGTWTLTVSDAFDLDGGSIDRVVLNMFGVAPFGTPSATATSPNVSAPGGALQTVTVTYNDETGIDVGTLGTGDVTVGGPNGFTVTPAFVSVTPAGNGAPRVATYTFAPPGGAWDGADNGTYTINVVANQVTDVTGQSVPPGPVGSFDVAIALNLVVTNLDDAGPGSLRQAVLDTNASPAADTITFQAGLAGTITLTAELGITDAVTIAGPGAGVVTVSGDGATRVFSVNSAAVAAPVNISGLTVRDGVADFGGGFYLAGDDFLNLDGVVITGNAAEAGPGGAILVGGAGFVRLVNSTMSGNTAAGSGGGVYFFNGGSLDVVGSTISGNTSGGGFGGGGIYFFGTASAAPPVGFTPNTLTITNTTISGNTSSNFGGGVAINSFTGTLLVRNTTVTLNTAAGAGGAGGIDFSGQTLTLANSVVSGNTAEFADVYSFTGGLNADNSFVGVQTGLTLTGSGNLAGDAKLGPLAANGGPTLTHLPLPGSPLIDAGSNALIPAGVTDDQRPDFPRVTGPSVDIGSTEFGSVGLGRVTLFAPATPGPVNTPAVFNLVFSNPIANLSAANFGLAPGAPAGSVIAVTGSGTTYTVTVTVPAGTEGTVTPQLVNATGVTPGVIATFPATASAGTFVDRITPTVTAFTLAGPGLTNAEEVSYSLTFSEGVALTADNFAAGPSGPPTVIGSGTTYTVTFDFPVGYQATFTPAITVAPTDLAGNPIALPAAGPAVTVDRLNPTVLSVTRVGPLRTNAASVSFIVTFSEALSEAPDSAVIAANFTVVTTLGGTVEITAITGTGATRTVTVSTGTGDGRVQLNFTSIGTVADPATNPLSLPAGGVTGQEYIVLRSPAVLSIEPTGPPTTNAPTATFLVTFNQPIGGVTASNFALFLADGATGTPIAGAVTAVTGTGATRTVTVSGLTGTGTVRLDFANGTGTNPPVNDIPGLGPVPFTEGTPIQVDRDLPAVVSLTRTGPAATNALSVSYIITFSEPVSGLTTENFAATQGADEATVTSVIGSGTTFTVTVATNNANGVLSLTLINTAGVTDSFANPATGAPLAAEPTRVFRIPPRVLSISLSGPGTTSAPSVTFVVTFTQPVFGVSAANFALAATVAGAQLVGFAPVAGDPSRYVVTATTGTGDGTLALSLINPAGIADEVNQPVTNTAVGPAYTIRKSPVTATAVELVGPPVTNNARGSFVVRFTEAVSGFDASDVVVSGPAGAGVVGFAPFNDGSPGAAYLVEVSYGSADGVVRVDLIDDGSITATATGLPLAGPADGGVRGPTVTVDRTGPVGTVTLAPGQAASVTPGTVQFALNYSEPVTGVANNLQIAANGVTYTAFTVAGGGASYTVTFTGVAGRGTLTLNGAAATDGAGNTSPPSAGATVTVTTPVVVPPPPAATAPVASADRFNSVIGKPVSGNLLTNDSGAGLSAVLVSGPAAAQGKLALNADGAFTFTPAANFTGAATFTYAARSSNGLTSTPATVTITVAGRTHFLAVGAGEGGGPVATVYNPDGSQRRSFFAYEETFRGGVRVATGDVTGDGVDDIIASPGRTGGPRVRVFDGVTGAVVYDFFAYSQTFTGGVYVASADVDGDGFADIVTGAGAGGGPHIQVFSGKTGESIRSFFAYVPDFVGGVQVAAGDLDGDGQAEIVVGAATGGPHVQAFDGRTGNQVRNFFAFDPTSAGGVTVAVGDINGDGFADIITGSGADARTRVYDGRLPALLAEQGLDVPFLVGGVRVAAKDTTGDNVVDVIAVTPAGGATPVLRRFTINGLRPLVETSPFDPSFFGGLYVG